MIYMVAYYDRISPCRIRRNMVIYGQKNDRLLPSYTEVVYDLRFAPFFSIYDRIVPYTVTEVYDRNTRPCNTAKYGRIWKNTEGKRSFMSVYGLRIRRPGLIHSLQKLWKLSCISMIILKEKKDNPIEHESFLRITSSLPFIKDLKEKE